MTFEPVSISNIMAEYEQTRLANKGLELQRRQEIYNKFPEIDELNSSSTKSYISSILNRLQGSHEENEKTPEETSRINRQRTARIEQILAENGYPADYLEPIYTCNECMDTGYVDGARCSCFLKKLIDKFYLQSNLNNIWVKENFDTFDTGFYSKDKQPDQEFSPYDNIISILESSKDFVEEFNKKGSHRGNILIYGEVGLGKTFLTNCIAKAVLDKGHQVLYLSSNELFKNVLSPYLMNQEKSLADLYKYVYNCELLIIDDLGTELTNSFVTSNLFEIINQRNISGKSTLISSNLGLKDLKDRYSERIMSRIIESYTVFNIYGENIRYQKRFK